MKIKRSVLLALAPFVGSACHVYASTEYPPPPPAPRTQVAPPPPPTATAGPASPTITTVHLQGAPAPSPPATPVPATVAIPAGAPTAPACADSGAGPVPDCGALRAADPLCSSSALPQQRCNAYRAYFNPKVAAIAVSCTAALSSQQLCDAARVYDCGRTALAQACPDSSVAQLCGIAATACKSSAGDCTTMISGLNDQGKQRVAQCVAQGCAAGLSSCVDGLLPASNATKAAR
ncbi:MAG: hypothetical protein M3O36_16250 [Myxococcota bacterium]|nr:hypothetical protein [Myxococcota bacterium]